jgi:2-keto-4-pentenoate hydratase/2-oxohepta-3-ene-1,7-dioic acid hydratase in catechol pathway
MRFARYQIGRTEPRFGWVHEDKIGVLEGNIFEEYRRMEPNIPLASVRLLPPVSPSKIICIGRNYVAHAKEHNADVPEVPLVFLKPPSAIIGDGDVILLPPQSQQVEHEAELVVVIGKPGRWITSEAAGQHILGYSIANDVSARDLQFRDGQWTRAKGFDTFCPFGPWIDTEFDPTDVLITCTVNGEIRQMASTRDMVFHVNQLVAFVSSIMTLVPGDIILTGTPSGVGPIVSGDIVEVNVEGLGTLRNAVRAEIAR